MSDEAKENDFREWLTSDLKVIDANHVTWSIFDVKCAWDYQKSKCEKLQAQLSQAKKANDELSGRLNEVRRERGQEEYQRKYKGE